MANIPFSIYAPIIIEKEVSHLPVVLTRQQSILKSFVIVSRISLYRMSKPMDAAVSVAAV